LFDYYPQFIDGISNLNGVDIWTIEKDIYKETIIKFFEFHYSFDKFAFSFEEINECSYNCQQVKEVWKENEVHSRS
jgi:hypothetical protein